MGSCECGVRKCKAWRDAIRCVFCLLTLCLLLWPGALAAEEAKPTSGCLSPSTYLSQLQDLDASLLERIQSHNTHVSLDYGLEGLSLISPFLEAGIVLEQLWQGYAQGDEQARDAGVLTVTALVATQLAIVSAKYAIARKRPPRHYRPRLPNTRITPSFPSGHTASSFAFAGAMGARYPRYRWVLIGYAL